MDTVFVNMVTLSDADWFTDLNRLHYTILQDPPNLAAVKALLGTGGMTFTGPALHADGTVAAPGISWASSPGTGFYRTGVLGFSVANNGVTVATWQRNSATHPQLLLYGGFSGLSDVGIAGLPLVIQSPTPAASAFPGIGLINSIGFSWTIQTDDAYTLRVGAASAAGPSSISGYALRITHDGNCSARSFTPGTFVATNVVPMTGVLMDVLKLRGVRCFNTETQRPDIRLELDDVRLAFPELITESRSPDGSTVIDKGINYMALAAPLIEAIRELTARVTALENAQGKPSP